MMPPPQVVQPLLDTLQKETFDYFVHEANEENGLILDKTATNSPASIAAVGLALTSYPIGVERGYLSRDDAAARTCTTLRYFATSDQGKEPNATGHRGFYYHFLDMRSGRRARKCELSTVDTALFLAGAVLAGQYFDRETEAEADIRALADQLYRRADWQWALNGGATVTHGWTPERGFLRSRWRGYDEALILYVLGLGSPTHPLPPESYDAWAASYSFRKIYGYEYLYAGPLFNHQMSHLWLDFRGIQDRFMRDRGIDYFENSRRATYVQQEYARRNPRGFTGYGENCWGITASNGPGRSTGEVHGINRRFFDYRARGVPFGPDDGTLAPWAVVASLPFAPEIVIPTVEWFNALNLRMDNPYGFKGTFNQTYPSDSASEGGWISPWHVGIEQGPIVVMIENYRSEQIWHLLRQCAYIQTGLRRAGFTGGWL